TVSGTGFGNSESITINFDSTQLGSATSDGSGNLPDTVISIPNSALYGPHTVQATSQTSTLSAQVIFFVETDWNQVGFDTQRDHFNPYENVLNTTTVPDLAQTWVAPTTSGISSEPVLANEVINRINTEVVFITIHTNLLYALNAA